MNNLQIEYFLTIADNLSFTKTAIEKYVSQPAISKQIATMEKELGIQLFERSRKSVKLTEAGAILANFYRKQREDLYELTNQLKDSSAAKSVNLRVGFGSAWDITAFMPSIASRMKNSHPEINLMLESHNFSELPVLLTEESLDVIISLDFILPATPLFVTHILTEIQRNIIYSDYHHLASHENLKPIDFKDELFFVPIEKNAQHILVFVKSFFEPLGFLPQMRGVKNVESLIANVTNGLGVAVTDSWTVRSSLRGLRHIPLDSSHVIVVAWRRDSKNQALPMFLQELAHVFYPDGNHSFF